MDEPSTCGQGLASQSVLPDKLGELLAALARILEAHMRALDPADHDARMELDAYAALVTAYRDVADRLSGIAVQMADYRNLPIAAHDEAAGQLHRPVAVARQHADGVEAAVRQRAGEVLVSMVSSLKGPQPGALRTCGVRCETPR